MNANISAKAEPLRSINREIYALQEIAERLAKAAAELDNSTACIRQLTPILNKECPPECTSNSNVAGILKGINDCLNATHRRLLTIHSEFDFDFPAGQ